MSVPEEQIKDEITSLSKEAQGLADESIKIDVRKAEINQRIAHIIGAIEALNKLLNNNSK